MQITSEIKINNIRVNASLDSRKSIGATPSVQAQAMG